MKRKINWKLVFNILSLLVPIGLVIYFLTSEQGLIDLMENASKMNLWWTGAGVLCQFLNITVDAIVLYLIIHNYEKKYTFKQAIKATVIGQFYSVITPGAVGGQPMQLYCMSKQGVDGGVASSCLLQKFLVYQTTITFYSLVAMLCNMSLFYGDLKNLMLSLALFGFLSHLVVVIFMFIFSFNRKLASSIINFFFRLLTGANPADMITAQAFVTMVSSFMPLPGGSGAAEGSFYVFFKLFFTENIIKSAILIWRIITYFMNVIVFAPFANVSKISKNKEVK